MMRRTLIAIGIIAVACSAALAQAFPFKPVS
jgi:hypothetical protein